MVVRTLAIMASLSSCGTQPVSAPNESSGARFIQGWERQARSGESLNGCLLKIRLPNPLVVSDFQELVRLVWESNKSHAVPVFYTYSLQGYLFVILSKHCSAKSEYARILRLTFRSHPTLKHLNILSVSQQESKEVISAIQKS